ncbi:MAG TPA: hypothetical protein VGM36_03745 [Rhizomicrobium sp.]|jgi:hypothetical protein
MDDNRFNFNPQSAMDVVRNSNVVSWERAAEAQKNAPAQSYGPSTFVGSAVGCGMMFAILGFVFAILEAPTHDLKSALIGGAIGFAMGAPIGVALHLLAILLGGVLGFLRATRAIRWTMIGAVLGVVAAFALTSYLNRPLDLDTAIVRFAITGAVFGFVFALLKALVSAVFRRKPAKAA